MRHLILISMLTLACSARAVFAGEFDIESYWFKPVLIENNDPACEALLADAQDKYFSDVSFDEAYGLSYNRHLNPATILDWQIVGGSAELTAFGNTYYLNHLRHPGCGGACETNQPLVSDKPFPKTRDYSYLKAMAQDAPPAVSYNSTIARASEDDVYLFSVSHSSRFKNQILIYKLAREGRWAPACKISTAPEQLTGTVSVKDAQILGVLEALKSSVFSLMGGTGNSCGSLKTNQRWKGSVGDALQSVLYRPWAIRERDTDLDSYGRFENDMKHLEQWSLVGQFQFNAQKQFREQLRDATTRLATLFHETNGWPEAMATHMASDALKGAVSTGIRFSSAYDPQFVQGEETLRRAILDKRDISEVSAIPFDVENIDRQISNWRGNPESRETILSVAIEYPEALDYLLKKGIDPDYANDFGKTPLMYAAQYNQIESARLLIKHGGNVNAVTTKPLDSCYYALRTLNMTPLHYAVRYASPELIRLLLDNGAQPFIKAEKIYSRPAAKESPLDWFRRYTSADGTGTNSNISNDQIAEIEKWLSLPTPEQAKLQASEYTLRAESTYQEGDVTKAYHEVFLATKLQPDNMRALSDLSLIALKHGKLGVSLQASQKIIKNSVSDKALANAWFNQGLACEYLTQKGNYSLRFNGNSYCDDGMLYPYLKAYVIAPTHARRNKLKELFDKHAVPYCQIYTGPGVFKINFQWGKNPTSQGDKRLQTMYVFQGKHEKITGENLAWNVTSSGKETTRIVPKKVASIDLGNEVINVFETTTLAKFPYRAFGTECSREDAMRVPKR